MGQANIIYLFYDIFSKMCFLFRFSLYYHADRELKDDEVKTDTKLTIETSVKKVNAAPEFDAEDEKEEPPLESLIRTK